MKRWEKVISFMLALVMMCSTFLTQTSTYAAEPNENEVMIESNATSDALITEEDSVEPEEAVVTDYYADRRHVIGTMTVYDDNGNFVDSFRQSWLQVNGETAYCMHVDKHFVNGYM